MTVIRIAIASDLHVGRAACSPSLRPGYSETDGDPEYVKKLISTIQGLGADYLVCPGDLTDYAEPAEFVVAESVLKQLADALNLGVDRILAVPGNHDVHWKLLAAAPSASPEQQTALRFQTMATSGNLGKALTARAPGIFTDPFVAIEEYPEALFLSFTTSAHDSKDQLLHYGRVTKASLDAAESLLSKIPIDHRCRIMVLHHHPTVWDTPGSDEPDPSVLVNAEGLFALAVKYKFDVLVHGHKHHPRFRVELPDGVHPIVVLSAGTFSRRIDSNAVGVSANQFHVIELEGRNPSTSVMAGRIKSWAWVPGLRKWVASDERSKGIGHLEVFGDYTLPKQLAATVTPIVKRILKKRSHCYWSEVCERDDRLKYCGKRLVKEVLQSLATAVSCRVHGDELDELLLVREP